MGARSMVALATVVSMLVGCSSCGGAAAGGAGTSSGESSSDEAFQGWSIPGLTLRRRCVAVPDEGTCTVYGLDPSGARVEGAALFTRLPELPALDLARRAHDVLLGESGQEPLDPAAREGGGAFVSDEEWSVITAPAYEGDRLVFYTMVGEMSPTAVRISIDRRTGALERRAAADVWADGAPAAGPATCERVLECGCERGCLLVEPVRRPRSTIDVYRTSDRRWYHRPQHARGALIALDETACEETCLIAAPTYACALVEGACAQTPLTP